MDVASIAEQLFFTTVRIETMTATGTMGAGTGFLFSHAQGEKTFSFVVSNKHVVQGMKTGWFYLLNGEGGKPKLGSAIRLEVDGWQNVWFGHPSADVDIAICPFWAIPQHLKVPLFNRFVASTMIPTATQIQTLDALESVTFIGYPNGIWDTSNFLPVARRGMTATPLAIDFENKPQFLIDASVFGGSSGSPVFLFNQGIHSDKSGNTMVGSRCLFLGVIASVFFRRQFNEIVAVPVPTNVQHGAEQHEMIDLGIVFKARTVLETVEAFLKAKNLGEQVAGV